MQVINGLRKFAGTVRFLQLIITIIKLKRKNVFSSSCIQRSCVLNFKLQLSFVGTAFTNFYLFLGNRNSFANIFKLN